MNAVVLRKVVFKPHHFDEGKMTLYQVSDYSVVNSSNLELLLKFLPLLHEVLPFISLIGSCRDIGSYTIPYFLFCKCRFNTIITLYTVHQLGVMYVRGLKIQISIKIM